MVRVPCMVTVALAALAACSAPSSRAPSDEKRDEQEKIDPASLVKLSLLAASDRAAPGGELELAARFAMKPGWHIYWINPGESGLDTEAQFRAPDGFEVGEVRFPGPIRFESPGGIVSYGYEGEAALFAAVRVPADAAGEARFEVEASWLACRESCVQGKGKAELVLPVGGGEPAPANEAALAPHRARLPRPWSELAGATTAWVAEADGRTLVVRVPGARALELFPGPDQPGMVAAVSSKVEAGAATASIRYRARAGAAGVASGVIRVGEGAEARYYSMSVPWEPEASKPEGGEQP